MTTTTTQESYVVYELDPEPFPTERGLSGRFDSRDQKFATTACLFVIIASVVLICLFFLIGHSFGYILLIILLVVAVALMVSFWLRRPLFLFGLRPTTSVKFPNYALHVIPAAQVMQNNNDMNANVGSNSGFYVYPIADTRQGYKTQTKIIN